MPFALTLQSQVLEDAEQLSHSNITQVDTEVLSLFMLYLSGTYLCYSLLYCCSNISLLYMLHKHG